MKINSIVFKMLFPLFLITILVVSATLFFTQTYLKNALEEIFVTSKVRYLEKIYSLKIENIFSEIKNSGLSIAHTEEVQQFLSSEEAKKGEISQEMMQTLAEFKKLYKLKYIFVAETQSRNYFNEKGLLKVIDKNEEEMTWFDKVLQSPQKYMINIDSEIEDTLNIWSDVVVEDKNHKRIGISGGGMDVSSLYDLTLEDFNKKNTNVIILNEENVILGTSNESITLNVSLRGSSLAKEKIQAIHNAKANSEELVKYQCEGDEERYLLFIPITELKYTIVIDFSKENFLSSLHGIYDRIIGGGIVFIILLFIVGGWTFTYLISVPLKKVALAVDEFDYTSDVELKFSKAMGSEIDTICSAFNKSTKLLRTTLDSYKNNEELLKSILNAADDMIFYKDKKSVYLGCNIAYEKWSTRSAKSIFGKIDRDFYPHDIAQAHIEQDQIAMNENKTVFFEEKLESDDGSYTILQIKKSPFYDKNGETIGIVVVARDITALKKMENDLRELNISLEKRVEEKTQELKKSNDLLEEHIENLQELNTKLLQATKAAQQAAQARSNFISSISHELRTPLNAIINFTDQVIVDFDEMLEDKELQTDTQHYLKRVIVNSKHLLQLINDLLEFTKAEVGKMEYSIEENNVNDLLKIAYTSTHSLLNGSDVEFKLSLFEQPLIALIDSRRFLQIILNLISNAIKFTKQGSVELRSFREEETIVVELEDTGKGIPEDKFKIIFEPFAQVKNTDQGTGLGLGLAKKMCDDMNMNLSFVSKEGSGTIFTLRFMSAE